MEATTITYSTSIIPEIAQVIALYESSGLNRPTHDFERMQKMCDNSNLFVTAWDGDQLVGLARSLTDFCWSCYLADLAVRGGYKKSGIGKRLIDLTKEVVGPQGMVLLLSVDTAMEYYPKVGMKAVHNGFIINRES